MDNKLFLKILILLTVFFTWLDITLNFTMHINQIFLLLSLVVILYYIIQNNIKIKTLIVKCTKNKTSRYIFVLLNLYILYDLVTFIYSPVKMYALSKYIVIIQMYILFLIIYYLCDEKMYLYYLFITIGIASVVLSVISFLAYIGLIAVYVPDIAKISLLKDYNIATTTILIGSMTLLFLMSKLLDKREFKKFIIYINLICILTIPVIYNGGSRRSVLLLGFDLIIVLLYYIFKLVSIKKINIKSISIIAFTILISFIFTMKVNELVINVSRGEKIIEYKAEPNDEEEDLDNNNKSKNTINNTYKTIYTGQALSKRKAIWNIALEEISNYNLRDMLIGKGSGYSSYIYSNVYEKQIQELYSNEKEVKLGENHPHNLFMIDILDGGIIKLLLSLTIWILILFQSIEIFKANKTLGIVLLISFTTILCNNMISGRFGYIYDKSFWIFLTLSMSTIKSLNNSQI